MFKCVRAKRCFINYNISQLRGGRTISYIAQSNPNFKATLPQTTELYIAASESSFQFTSWILSKLNW